MGGDTMVSILSAATWLQSKQYRLILQCQSKTPMLRQYLSQNGWGIEKETVLKDGRFLYTVMEVTREHPQVLTPGECYFPPALTDNEYLSAYYNRVVAGLETIVQNQKEQADPFAVQALDELRKKVSV
jgi:tRNA A22 N-methylase